MLNNYGLGITLRTTDQSSAVFDKVGNKFTSVKNMFNKGVGDLTNKGSAFTKSLSSIFSGFKTGGLTGGLKSISSSFGGLMKNLPQLSSMLPQLSGAFAKLGAFLQPPFVLIIAAVALAFVGLVKVISKAIEITREFEKAMANVSTMLEGDVDKRVVELTEDVERMQMKFGFTAKDLNQGLYDVVSAFGDTVETAKQLEIVSKTAAAGLSTTSESLGLLSAVSKAYNDTSAESLQKISDLYIPDQKGIHRGR